ncbi:MAG: 5-formyltetrahydrofolate cyclo-ligase [Alphaproteobacteria bacterium]|nr:5-formyltetrahydrofolate cyclo-ligase [Alphaproteobacteria bacterium]
MTLDQDKQAVRERAAANRDRFEPDARDRAAAALPRIFLEKIVLTPGSRVSAFWPAKGEIDVRVLLRRLHEAGHVCGLPVVAGHGRPLLFRRWTPDTVMRPGNFRIPVPPESAELLTPDVVLVPLLAFDRNGNRLGWGAGFYDRTLAALRADHSVVAIGIAFAGQEIERVPHGSQDEKLDWIVTEQEAIRVGSGT